VRAEAILDRPYLLKTTFFSPGGIAMTHKESTPTGLKTIVFVLVGGSILAVVLGGLLLIRPYDTPEFVEIGSSESAFLIPLEGDTTNQAAFHSVKFLEQKKVAAKRIQITHRWNQTGFAPTSGQWIPIVRLIKVDRRPITREWTRSAKTGTSAKDEAIAAESRESVNFSIGVSCTAHIPEELAAVFLYSYPSKSLAEMLDMEVRARIHQVIAEEAGKYDLVELPSKKNDIMKVVREDVVPFFQKKGIDITTLAVLGGLSFDNPEIQKAIDDAAKGGQLKTAAEARRVAQEVENRTTLLAAEGKAAAAKREAQARVEAAQIQAEGEAKIRLRAAEAEAEALRKLADAKAYEAAKANESPETYLRLKGLEAEIQRWKQWDGRYPAYLIQLSNADTSHTPFFLQPPPLPQPARTAAQVDGKK
jgi:regulator of protease activity HflC (stomatin/prohibitin superfamily)